MNRVCSLSNASASGFLAAVWPATDPADSGPQRRRKILVRTAQVAVAVMVIAGVAGSLLMDLAVFTIARATLLVGAAVLYTVWSLNGMRDTVRQLLDEEQPLPAGAAVGSYTVLYFGVQLGLGAMIYVLSGTRGGSLAWLVLLPPIAHSAILLPRSGIALVSTVTVLILACSVAYRHGWSYAASASVAFCFAVCFTLVFTLLAVSAERSRAEVQKLANELGAANSKLRRYAVEAEELSATRERNRLAREIHDSLGHYLTVVNVQLEAAKAVLLREPTRADDALAKAQSLTQEGLREIRRSVAALRSSPLENRSVVAALNDIVEESRQAGVNAKLDVAGDVRSLSPAAELTLYRAAQEGLTNVRKHAFCSRAVLALDFRDPAMVQFSVSDDGVGPGPGRERGFGLIGLHERAQLVGGAMRTSAGEKGGFVLQLSVPG